MIARERRGSGDDPAFTRLWPFVGHSHFLFCPNRKEGPQQAALKADGMTADTIHITAHIAVTEPADRAMEQAVGHSAPPLSPGQPAVDLAHLARMTLGEKGLEREVLDLFERQADMLLARMAAEGPRMLGALAHTLAGSASGIGAWRVAEAATALERAAAVPGTGALAGLVDHLAVAVAEVHAAIRDMQHAN
jgi:HPt (histidine-containing phosphotransfer) domain-containing protein